MSKPLIQIDDDKIREMTDEEYAEYLSLPVIKLSFDDNLFPISLDADALGDETEV